MVAETKTSMPSQGVARTVLNSFRCARKVLILDNKYINVLVSPVRPVYGTVITLLETLIGAKFVIDSKFSCPFGIVQ